MRYREGRCHTSPTLRHSPANAKQHETDKLQHESELCRFKGYPKDIVGYNFYHPEEYSLFITKRVIFLEDEYLL